jgi:hypothetical protein
VCPPQDYGTLNLRCNQVGPGRKRLEAAHLLLAGDDRELIALKVDNLIHQSMTLAQHIGAFGQAYHLSHHAWSDLRLTFGENKEVAG